MSTQEPTSTNTVISFPMIGVHRLGLGVVVMGNFNGSRAEKFAEGLKA